MVGTHKLANFFVNEHGKLLRLSKHTQKVSPLDSTSLNVSGPCQGIARFQAFFAIKQVMKCVQTFCEWSHD